MSTKDSGSLAKRISQYQTGSRIIIWFIVIIPGASALRQAHFNSASSVSVIIELGLAVSLIFLADALWAFFHVFLLKLRFWHLPSAHKMILRFYADKRQAFGYWRSDWITFRTFQWLTEQAVHITYGGEYAE